MFDVGEIGRVATAMIWMTIGAAGTTVSGALALGHTDALHVKIRDVLGSVFGLICCDYHA
jgi:hypothetical protein